MEGEEVGSHSTKTLTSDISSQCHLGDLIGWPCPFSNPFPLKHRKRQLNPLSFSHRLCSSVIHHNVYIRFFLFIL